MTPRHRPFRVHATRRAAALALALTLGVAITPLAPAGPAAAQAEVTISIASFAFAPDPVTVAAGQPVVWTNQDAAPHTATGPDHAWDSDTLKQGESYRFTPDTPGTYAYYCAIHPTMKATLIVQ